MSAPLLSTTELAAIRGVAESGMVTPVQLLRLIVTEGPTGDEEGWADNGTVQGWVYSTPTPMITVVSGAQALVNTYRLFVPVGTDILTGDRVGIGIEQYTVSDTTAESTWLPMLTVSLRKVE